MSAALEAELEFAVAAAHEGGARTLDWFGDAGMRVDHKGDGTPVTAADQATEALLRQRIHAEYPDDAVIGEEAVDQPGTSGRTWVIDPIDGTKSFTHGVPLFATLVALVDEQGPAIGVIHMPALGESVWAARGSGCFHDGEPTCVRSCATVAGAWLMTSGLGVWDLDALERVIDAGVHVRTWADAYGYLLVATGRVDAMVDPVASVWDLAAPAVVITEAGGTFTTLDGSTDPAGGSGLATAGGIHDELLAMLGPIS